MPFTQYALQFTGLISWEGQSNGLPSEIHAYLVVESYGGPEEKAFIDSTIEAQAAAFTRNQSMVVQRDQGQIIDMRQTPADRLYVPMKWIVSISTAIHKLGAELSEPDTEGVERLRNGDEPLKN